MSQPNKTLRIVALAAATVFVACSDTTGPTGTPSDLNAVTPTTATGTAGLPLTGGASVVAVDSRGHGVSGAKVQFRITDGDGTISSRLVLSDGSGLSHVDWILGQTAGVNTVIASLEGIDSTATFTATGTAGAAAAVAVNPRTLRLPAGTTTAAISGAVVDQFGNVVTGAATFVSRNPGLVTVNPTTGGVSVVGSGGTTYVVATGSSFTDSSLVIVLTGTDTPCTGITARVSLAVGQVTTTGFSDNGICVNATAAGAEYALVPYFDSPVPLTTTTVTMSAFGIKTPGVLGSARRSGTPLLTDAASATASAALSHGATFHDGLRLMEEQSMPSAAATARLWYATEQKQRRAYRAAVVPAVGDQLQLNVEPNTYCAEKAPRMGRVAAVTQRAVVVADVNNPPGFTDAEYQSFGVTFDTLVYAVDVANFGPPTDLDNNGGRVILFFTHRVNEEGPGVLGYYTARDLLPKKGPLGSCPGSNVAEMVYLLVPDSQYPKNFVLTNTVATVAHEFQHLINAARRLYVNTSATPTEERWLNEGLSHIAEELMFYRTSGLMPRQNLGSSPLNSPQVSQAFSNYQVNNFQRLREYLKTPETQSPVGKDDNDDDFETRGSIWSYLRYIADQRFAANEPAFWTKLVNSNSTGIQNLNEAVGADAHLTMRDWTLAIFLDDLVAGIDPKYQQLSWNYRQTVSPYAPRTTTLANGLGTPVSLSAGGTTFARFGVISNSETYVRAAGPSGTAFPRHVLLALVRTK